MNEVAVRRHDLGSWQRLDLRDRRTRLEASLALSEEITESHHAYITVRRYAPRERPRGALAGVPFAVKDNVDVRGFPTTAGSPLLKEHVPEVDADVVSVLLDEGAVVVGKANMHELAFGVTSDNATYGPVRNPFDLTRTAGGSSGGSAVAVALGHVPFSLGTDTGGSVLIPSAFCGIVGFRPTTGRYPGAGVVHLSTTRDTVGIHSWTVGDVITLDRLITHDRTTPLTFRPSGLVLGRVVSRFRDVDKAVAEAVERMLGELRDLGVTIVDVDLGDDLELAAEHGQAVVRFEAERLVPCRTDASGARHRTLAECLDLVASTDVRDIMRGIVDEPVSAEEYDAARRARWGLQRRYAEAFAASGAVALLGPTCAVPPPRFDQDRVPVGGKAVPVFPAVIRNAGPGTFAGLPMISIPVGLSDDGLPVGLMLEGPAFEDSRLLACGSAIEMWTSSASD